MGVTAFFAFVLYCGVRICTTVVLGGVAFLFDVPVNVWTYEVCTALFVGVLCTKGLLSIRPPSAGYLVRVAGIIVSPMLLGFFTTLWFDQLYSVDVGIYGTLALFVHQMVVMHQRRWIRSLPR